MVRLSTTKYVTGLALISSLYTANVFAAPLNPLSKPLNMTFCVYDVAGNGGDLYRYAKDLSLFAQKWNVNAKIRVYTDERVIAEDFKANQCDGIAVSTLRAKQFNNFVGSIDSIGSAPSYRHIKELVSTFNHPKIAPLTIQGDYQVVTVMPLGASYVMVNNRHIDSVEKATGKKVAVIETDKAHSKLVHLLGAQAINTDFYNFANLFNNGQVDIITAPAIAFKPLELSKGLSYYGGIYRLPIMQMTGTVLINRTNLAKQIPDLDLRLEQIRQYALGEMDKTIAYIEKTEKAIPQQYWLDLSDAEKNRYITMMREARNHLTKEGYYDERMMNLMKKVRCKISPSDSECGV
ncbi:MAG TPA: DUF6091 family protein [Agitococcus sp.]|nr:DUF6091 family protein [Agitococcus sp.]